MTTQSKIIIANIVGIVVLALGMFGISVDPETQAQIVAGLGAIGTVINMAIVMFRGQKTLAEDEIQAAMKRNEGGYVRPSLCCALAGVLLLAASVGALPGCSTHGAQPQTAREALALGYTAHTALARSVTAATVSGSITVDQAEQARDALSQSLAALEAARQLIAAGQSADSNLHRAAALLTVVESILLMGAEPR
jgi:hypothetical protein